MPATELNVGVCSEEKCNSNIKKIQKCMQMLEYEKYYVSVGIML
jgi:hypothetical protein